MGHTSRNMEVNDAEFDLMNCWGLPQEVSEEENFSMLPRDHSSNILLRNMVAFCLCLTILPEAKVKSFVLMLLAKEISKQLNIDRLCCVVISVYSNDNLK